VEANGKPATRFPFEASSGIRRVTAGVLALIAAVGALGSPSRAAPGFFRQSAATLHAQSVPSADRPPAGLLELGEAAKWLFDAAYASDWRTAAERMRSVSQSASALPSNLPKADIIVQLAGARRPADYVAPTRAELSEADRVEKLLGQRP
jgi:hypothetical protein